MTPSALDLDRKLMRLLSSPALVARTRLRGIDLLATFRRGGYLTDQESHILSRIADLHGKADVAQGLTDPDTVYASVEALLSDPKIAAMIEDFKTPLRRGLDEAEALDASGKLPSEILEILKESAGPQHGKAFTDPQRFAEDLETVFGSVKGAKELAEVADLADGYSKRAAVIRLLVNPFDREVTGAPISDELDGQFEFYHGNMNGRARAFIDLHSDIGWGDWDNEKKLDNRVTARWHRTFKTVIETESFMVPTPPSEFSAEVLQQVSENLLGRTEELQARDEALAQERFKRSVELSAKIVDVQNAIAAGIDDDYQSAWTEEDRTRDGGDAKMTRRYLVEEAKEIAEVFIRASVNKIDPDLGVKIRVPRTRDDLDDLSETQKAHYRFIAPRKVKESYGPRSEQMRYVRPGPTIGQVRKRLAKFPLPADHPLTVSYTSALEKEWITPMRMLGSLTKAMRDAAEDAVDPQSFDVKVDDIARSAISQINKALREQVFLSGKPSLMEMQTHLDLFLSEESRSKAGADLVKGVLELGPFKNITAFVDVLGIATDTADHVLIDDALDAATADPRWRASFAKMVQGSKERLSVEDGRPVVGLSKIPLATLLHSRVAARHRSSGRSEIDDDMRHKATALGEAVNTITLNAEGHHLLERLMARIAEIEERRRRRLHRDQDANISDQMPGPVAEDRSNETKQTSDAPEDKEPEAPEVEPGMVPGGPRRSWLNIFR